MERISQTQLEGLTPVELIARLYRGAIDFIEAARSTDDAASRRQGLDRAISIVESLQDHLDHEAGGEIASNLDDLYEYVRLQLLGADGDAFEATTRDAAGLLERLASGWSELAEQSTSAPAAV